MEAAIAVPDMTSAEITALTTLEPWAAWTSAVNANGIRTSGRASVTAGNTWFRKPLAAITFPRAPAPLISNMIIPACFVPLLIPEALAEGVASRRATTRPAIIIHWMRLSWDRGIPNENTGIAMSIARNGAHAFQ